MRRNRPIVETLEPRELLAGVVVEPQTTDAYSTIYSIGVDWYFAAGSDSDHDATGSLQYRALGSTAWKDALPMKRVDHLSSGTPTTQVQYNMVSGSIFFLQPATQYEMKITLNDPDGVSQTKTLNVQTKPVPSYEQTPSRTFHVNNGTTTGNGSAATPYTLAQAITAAQPGDVFLLHAGQYKNPGPFTKSGSASSYIVWKSAGDGEVLFRNNNLGITTKTPALRVRGSYQWFEGFTFRDQSGVEADIEPGVLYADRTSQFCVVTRCQFLKTRYGIALMKDTNSTGWYIADNIFKGSNIDPSTTQGQMVADFTDGQGVVLFWNGGATIANNTFSLMADAVSYPGKNTDVFANEIFDTNDDGIEADYSYQNVRIWQNRITNVGSHSFSFQAQNMGPWYHIRNQVQGWGSNLLKLKFGESLPTDNFYIQNTFIGYSTYGGRDTNGDTYYRKSYSRNNVFISIQVTDLSLYSSPGSTTWQTNIDYDAYVNNSAPLLGAHEQRLSFSDFTANKSLVYQTPYHNSQSDGGGVPFRSHPLQHWSLAAGSSAIDSGAVLANVNDPYVADGAPDRGALEAGQPLPFYGARWSMPWISPSSDAIYYFSGPGPSTALTLHSGAAALTSDARATMGNISVNVQPGAIAQFDAQQHLAKLNIGAAATVLTFLATGPLHVDSLSLAPTARLDLKDNDLIVEKGDYANLRAHVLAGFPPGATTGITSSASNGNQILALFDNTFVGATTWNNEPVGANAIIGKFTRMGDMNLDGLITGDDYTVIDANLNSTPSAGLAWLAGDANLDGLITGDDYTVIDANLDHLLA